VGANESLSDLRLGESMPHCLRSRFWVESLLVLVTGLSAAVTLFWHDWIEIVFRVDPDKGSGLAEWLIVAILTIVAVTLSISARFEWRRARLAER
jgi:hypothetical protein